MDFKSQLGSCTTVGPSNHSTSHPHSPCVKSQPVTALRSKTSCSFSDPATCEREDKLSGPSPPSHPQWQNRNRKTAIKPPIWKRRERETQQACQHSETVWQELQGFCVWEVPGIARWTYLRLLSGRDSCNSCIRGPWFCLQGILSCPLPFMTIF